MARISGWMAGGPPPVETETGATGPRGMLPSDLGKDVVDKLKKEVLDRIKGPQA